MTVSEKQSMLCPNCNKLISRDEPRCPHCGIANPGAWWKNNILVKGFSQEDQVIRVIIYINIGMYALSLFLYPISLGLSSPLNALSPHNNSLLLLGATGTIPIEQLNRWWTILSANYLHGSLLHIIFNMIALRQLGTLILHIYGIYRMIIIYTLTGVIGYLVSYLADVRFTIGASAAVCGLIGAALYYGKHRGGTFGEAIYKQVFGWLIGLFFIGMMPNINNWGHGGGVLAGILMGFLLGYPEKRRERLLDKTLAGVCIGATVLVLAWALLTGIYYRLFGG